MADPNTADASTPRKKDKPQAVLTVKGKRRLSPSLVRVILGGHDFELLRFNPNSDSYVKLLLPVPGSGALPPYDFETLRDTAPDLLPKKRTYTVRRWDHEAKEIWIDFVIHNEPGSTGVASDWADSALPGDQIALMGAGGGYAPDDAYESHLLIGDLAAAPAIAASLAAMPENARGTALIQVEHGEDQIADMKTQENLELRWITGSAEDLYDAVVDLRISDGVIKQRKLQVFCHAEREMTKRLRHHLVKERGITRSDISISAYWAQGRIEDQFQAEKATSLAKLIRGNKARTHALSCTGACSCRAHSKHDLAYFHDR